MSATYQPLRGFRDLYPEDKAKQQYIFDKIRDVARLFGYEEYDGPIVEPRALYENKSSTELLEKQTFQVSGKDESDKWILRPEMTPTLARMVASRAGELIFPLRLFNIGARFRYEAPQKGRSREFWQSDFDILGNEDAVADAEVLATALSLFLSIGATTDDIVVNINSRRFMEQKLQEVGITKDDIPKTLSIIDRIDKDTESKLETPVQKLIQTKVNPKDNPYFQKLFALLKEYEIDQFCQINTSVVRGLDYYTGLVFEIKRKNTSGRSTILGGGRYDNLIADFNPNLKISGVGFAVSDVVLIEFLKDKNLFPNLLTKQTQVLITIFDDSSVEYMVKIVNELRRTNIPAELYPSSEKKLDKQLKYADRNNIPYVVIAGPEEIQKSVYKLKDLKTQKQQEVTKDELLKILKS